MTLRPRDRRRQEGLGTAERLRSACLELALTLGTALGWPGEGPSAVTLASWGEGFWHPPTRPVMAGRLAFKHAALGYPYRVCRTRTVPRSSCVAQEQSWPREVGGKPAPTQPDAFQPLLATSPFLVDIYKEVDRGIVYVPPSQTVCRQNRGVQWVQSCS